jgi:hypothetical protein
MGRLSPSLRSIQRPAISFRGSSSRTRSASILIPTPGCASATSRRRPRPATTAFFLYSRAGLAQAGRLLRFNETYAGSPRERRDRGQARRGTPRTSVSLWLPVIGLRSVCPPFRRPQAGGRENERSGVDESTLAEKPRLFALSPRRGGRIPRTERDRPRRHRPRCPFRGTIDVEGTCSAYWAHAQRAGKARSPAAALAEIERSGNRVASQTHPFSGRSC